MEPDFESPTFNRGRDINHGDSSYVAALPYSDKRILEPTRVIIPPPNLEYGSGQPAFRVASLSNIGRVSESFGNPEFLRSILPSYNLEMTHSILSWRYENRRQAQPILPFLLLGPSSVARDATFVQKNGITFMLAVRSAAAVKARPKFLHPSTFSSSAGMQVSTFDLDTPYDLITNLRPTMKAMNDHLEQISRNGPVTSVGDIEGKILVYCESGNERSAVVVAAYLMVIYGVDTVTAIQIIQSQRFCINIDEGMKKMLLDLDAILKAEREVAQSTSSQDPSWLRRSGEAKIDFHRPTKRNLDDVYDSDENSTIDGPGAGNIQGRVGIAPFSNA